MPDHEPAGPPSDPHAEAEANIILAGLLDGASHATCESCRKVMRQAHSLISDLHAALTAGAPHGDGDAALTSWVARLATGIDWSSQRAPISSASLVEIIEAMVHAAVGTWTGSLRSETSAKYDVPPTRPTRSYTVSLHIEAIGHPVPGVRSLAWDPDE